MRIKSFFSYLTILFAVSCCLLVYILTSPIPVAYDVAFHVRFMADFHQALIESNGFPDWDARPYQGTGTPAFRFYAPAVYLLGSLFITFGATPTSAIKWVLFIYCLFGTIGVLWWFDSLGLSKYRYLGAILFCLSPFFAVHLFQMLFFQNICALFVFPWVLTGWQNGKKNPWGTIFCGLSLGIMGFTHLPATLMAGYFLALLSILETISSRNLTSVLRLGVVGTFAGSIIAPYALPAMYSTEEINFYILDTLTPWNRYDFIDDKFVATNGSDLWEAIRQVFRLGILICIIPAFVGFFAVIKSTWDNKQDFIHISIAWIVGIFMTIRASLFLWYLLPGLKKLQFPWRFALPSYILMIPSLALALNLKADSFAGKFSKILAIIGLVGTVILTFTIQYYRKPVKDLDAIFSITHYFPSEYLPISCRNQALKWNAGEVRKVALHNGKIIEQKHAFASSTVTCNVSENTIMEIYTHWDPWWRIRLNGIETAPLCLSKCGIMGVHLKKGFNKIEIYRDQPPERFWGFTFAIVVFVFWIYRVLVLTGLVSDEDW